jgi:hypothetical protein
VLVQQLDLVFVPRSATPQRELAHVTFCYDAGYSLDNEF